MALSKFGENSPMVVRTKRVLLTRLILILLGAVVIRRTNLLSHLFLSENMFKTPYFLGLFFSLIALITLIYILLFVKPKHGVETYRLWKVHAPVSVPLLSGSGCGAFVCFTVSCLPVYGLWSPIIFFIISIAMMNLLNFL